MNENIARFLKQQTCATICCIDEEGYPYCFNCFYAFDVKDFLLYFKSSPNAHHSTLLSNNPFIAGTVLPDKLNILAIKGIQLKGEVLNHQHHLAECAFEKYHIKYPMAYGMCGTVFTIQVNEIKMKDDRMGLRKKITWARSQ